MRTIAASCLSVALTLLAMSQPCLADSYPDKLHIQSLLEKREFRALDKLLTVVQENSEKDIARETEVQLAFNAFAVSKPEFEPLLAEWVTQFPKSNSAWLARAKYFENLGWDRRGSKWAKDTTDDQIKGMNSAFADAVRSTTTALSLRPATVECYAVLINIAMTRGEAERELALTRDALKAVPESFRVRRAHMQALLPRWGGSYEEMQKFTHESQAYASKNPKLRWLRGMVAWDQGNVAVRDKNYELAIRRFTEALEAGEYNQFYTDRADAYNRMKQYDRALADANQALQLYPQAPETLAERARTLVELGRLDEAKRDLALAWKIDPGTGRLKTTRAWLASKLVRQGWELQKQGDYDKAIADLNEAVKADPAHAEALYWRGRTHEIRGDLNQAQADLEGAIRLNPRYFEAYRSLDWVLGRSNRWDEIIANWNRFLELESNHADAHLERAGTYRRKGNNVAAMQDLKKACDLGSAKACEIVARERGASTAK
jgi:tetratricopeptide (TPR) repeat protein